MPTIPPVAPSAPTVPVRSDRAGFPVQMYNFFSHIAGAFNTFLEDIAANVYGNATDAYNSASAAAASESAAAASAVASAAAASAPVWASGTYTAGDCVYSPTNFQTYRRTTTGSSATDPAIDSTGWLIVSALSFPMVDVAGTSQTATAFRHYILSNAAASTLTLPAAPSAGDEIWVTVGNARVDNVVDRAGKSIQGVAENMTLDIPATARLKYINSTVQWRLV